MTRERLSTSPRVATDSAPAGGWRRRTGALARRMGAVAIAAAVAATSLPAPVQAAGLPLIRDAEIENLVRDYAQPILKAAGLGGSGIEIYILRNGGFNAFVADGRRMFINTGTLTESTTPNQLIGVIAHETGHIAGGHLARLREQLSKTQTAAVIGMLLGAAAAAAASAAGASARDIGQMGSAAAQGGQHVAHRNLLAYQRTEEAAADRAALTYLDATGQSGRGMLEVFQRFADQSMFTTRYTDPYVQSHPMPRERIALLEQDVKASRNYGRDDAEGLKLRHELMRAKLHGFLEAPQSVRRRYPANDRSLPASYARAIATYRTADIRAATREIDALIQAMPSNPYFWELKGQALLESGRPGEAVQPLQHAVSLAPKASLIRILLGQALVATGDSARIAQAVEQLRQGLKDEPNHGAGFRTLAMAYGRLGDEANASLASAQAFQAEGDFRSARQHAARAKKLFQRGSPGWLRADDIMNITS